MHPTVNNKNNTTNQNKTDEILEAFSLKHTNIK